MKLVVKNWFMLSVRILSYGCSSKSTKEAEAQVRMRRTKLSKFRSR